MVGIPALDIRARQDAGDARGVLAEHDLEAFAERLREHAVRIGFTREDDAIGETNAALQQVQFPEKLDARSARRSARGDS